MSKWWNITICFNAAVQNSAMLYRTLSQEGEQDVKTIFENIYYTLVKASLIYQETTLCTVRHVQGL